MSEVVAGICPKHGFWKGDRCEKCITEKKDTIYIDVFKPMVYQDLAEYPILIESKRQLRRECKERGLIAARLL